MNVIMDACSVINLHNGGVLALACSLDIGEFRIGPIAGGECSADCAKTLAALHDDGLIHYLADSPLDGDDFLAFVDDHRLGDGEAECIMLAALDEDSVVCCDDMRGRKKVVALLGEERLTGSIGLLTRLVANGHMDSDAAYTAYLTMREHGGFLPDLQPGYFED